LIVLVCAFCTLWVTLRYVQANLSVTGGEYVLMPLDDAYIHFQYARQIAAGEFYVYNPGQPPTSGATSFLYPYVLAVGYLLGFQGLNLGVWALIVGGVALLGSLLLAYQITVRLTGKRWVSLGVPVLMALHGLTTWHFMSGMETGLAILFTLAVVNALVGSDVRGVGVFGAMLTITRPEGAILAVIAVGVMGIGKIISLRTPHLRDEPHPQPLTEFREGSQTRRVRGPSRIREAEKKARHSDALQGDTPTIMENGGCDVSRPYSAGKFVGVWWLVLPVIALGVQPLVNVIVTGSAVATGNAAKSLFGMIPPDMGVIAGRIGENFIRMWREFVTFGGVESHAMFGLQLLVMGSAATLVMILMKAGSGDTRTGSIYAAPKRIAVGLMMWAVGFTLAIATLDTAFWHFKRYQMPLIALFFPLGTAGVVWVSSYVRAVERYIPLVFMVGMLVIIGAASGTMFAAYTLNVGYVNAQPYQMAVWLRENAPDDAVIAVHDVGMMRYLGGHTTLDMVGLTTPGAAEYWRNGPGSIGEFLLREQPDLIAAYGEGHGLGLGYLQNTDLYAQALAQYTVEPDPVFNVALAAATQGIYQPNYEIVPHQRDLDALPSLYPDVFSSMNWVSSLNVADLESERDKRYRWSNQSQIGGFPTEFFMFQTVGCEFFTCRVMDGGRRINGEERFMMRARVGEDSVLVSRIHAVNRGTFDVYVNDQLVGTRVIPLLPGEWFEVATFIPGELITTDEIDVRIVPYVPAGVYMPFQHWLFASFYPAVRTPPDTTTSFQDGNILVSIRDASGITDPRLLQTWVAYQQLNLSIQWFTAGDAVGDYVYFLHVYPADDLNVEPLVQFDARPGGGMLPPGNWLPGSFRDTISLNLSGLAPGRYILMLGLYDPVTFERLRPANGDADGRFLVGQFEIR